MFIYMAALALFRVCSVMIPKYIYLKITLGPFKFEFLYHTLAIAIDLRFLVMKVLLSLCLD